MHQAMKTMDFLLLETKAMKSSSPNTYCFWNLYIQGLLCMMIIPVSSGTVYVQSGSDITDCNMKCPHDDVTVELYRQCGGKQKTLLENHSYHNNMKSHDPRLQLHTGSGCWMLTPARKDDSCVYKIWCHCDPGYLPSSTDILVLDSILISNITNNCSRLGEEMAVSIQFSGEESAVTWEVDGEPLPERYRLIDDNRTLIIPSVQRDDAERRFRVRITNPVSEKIQEYRLEIRDSNSYRRRLSLEVFLMVGLGVLGILQALYFYTKYRRSNSNIQGTRPLEGIYIGSVLVMKKGSLSGTSIDKEPVFSIYK
ncbi:uncharacterized protein LOC143981648 isoform X3 [Lithobates pipiens]